MVAKVIAGRNIRGVLSYNERKVEQGLATCIHANLFIRDPAELSFYDKLDRFTDLTERNRRTQTNAVHISLNFDPKEKLEDDGLERIAGAYMEKIGFGDQPYLVYRHFDAAHPHIHIVTTNIRENGKRISLHNIGRNQSEVARKEVEQEFGLVRAESKKNDQRATLHPVDVRQAVEYGKSETRRSLSNVVRTVTRSYKYTSLPELNAALRLFNVTAERGSEGSQMYKKKGLIYSLLDKHGKRVGIPVKASAIYGKPTLAFLEKQFTLNEALRQPFRESLKREIDEVLRHRAVKTSKKFRAALQRKGIDVIFRTNAEGRTYGVTFVDHKSKAVFNGSKLGKSYSAKGILERLSGSKEAVNIRVQPAPVALRPSGTSPAGLGENVIEDLIRSEATWEGMNPEITLKLKKKRRRKGQSL